METTNFNIRFQPIALTAATGSQLLGLTFGYPSGTSNNGSVVSATAATSGGLSAQQVFSYDAYNRLSLAVENPTNAASPVCPDAASHWCQAYAYDQFGNRAVSAYEPQVSSFLNPNWMPSSLTQFNGSNQWTRGAGDAYGHSGNLVKLASNSSPGIAAATFSYDAENRMTVSNVSNTGNIQYVYDGSGQRVEKIAGATTTVYVYDAQEQLAAEYSTATNPVTGTEYLTSDPLGSTRLVTNSTQAVVKRYDYVPFGEEIPVEIGSRAASDGYGGGIYQNSPDVVSEKFTGKERDSESGLDYFGARYYGSALGRFTSPDPIYFQAAMLNDPQRFNLYAYGRNNPLIFVDPTGEAIELSDDKDKREKELAALKAAVGAKAGSYLYDNVDKKTGKHYVGILSGGPSGKDADFASINKNTKIIGDVVGSTNVAQIELVPRGTETSSASTISGLYPAETTATANGARSDILNGQFGPVYGLIQGAQTQDDEVPTLAEVLAHKLSHVHTAWFGKNENSNREAVEMETRVRKIEKRRGERIGHDKPGDLK